MSKFVIRPVPTGVKFDLKATNGETVLTSEVYASTAACIRGIESVRRNAPKAKIENQTEEDWKTLTNPKFEVYQDRGGAFRFRLKARNGAIIAVSEGYTAKHNCFSCMEVIQATAAGAETEL